MIVEVHYCPSEAQCDGPQALLPEVFAELMDKMKRIAEMNKMQFVESAKKVRV